VGTGPLTYETRDLRVWFLQTSAAGQAVGYGKKTDLPIGSWTIEAKPLPGSGPFEAGPAYAVALAVVLDKDEAESEGEILVIQWSQPVDLGAGQEVAARTIAQPTDGELGLAGGLTPTETKFNDPLTIVSGAPLATGKLGYAAERGDIHVWIVQTSTAGQAAAHGKVSKRVEVDEEWEIQTASLEGSAQFTSGPAFAFGLGIVADDGRKVAIQWSQPVDLGPGDGSGT